MAAAFAGGALLLSPVLALGDTAWLAEPAAPRWPSTWACPTALAYVLFARGLEKLPAANVATITLAEPLTAATLGVAILGERPARSPASGRCSC